MRTIRLLDLGTVPAIRSQTCYHAAARALAEGAPDTMILVSPAAPYVCIGYHQDLSKEVDRDYCASRHWPVYRREVGGGAVYLDQNQVFVQWVFQPSSLPADVGARFRLFVEPIVLTYRALGIEARYRPVNDIQVGGKKIGGTGAARIGRAEVVVGSLMFDFDKPAMARVLRVSSEKMRDKVYQGLQQYMTTLRDELGTAPDRDAVIRLYLEKCSEVLEAGIVPGGWTEEEETLASGLDRVFGSGEWLEQKGGALRLGVKIHEDVRVHEADLKTAGGLVRVTARLWDGRIDDISISGDFTIYPRSAASEIETALKGLPAEAPAVLELVRGFYRDRSVQSPGLEPEDWAEAFAAALKA